MDKFLAKKQQIFTTNDVQRHILMTNIAHITLKSLYENVRLYRLSLYGY
jgi:hypothetical protein